MSVIIVGSLKEEDQQQEEEKEKDKDRQFSLGFLFLLSYNCHYQVIFLDVKLPLFYYKSNSFPYA